MKKLNSNFEEIRNENRLLFEYTRGSTAYNLNTPESDVDTGGIFLAEPFEYCTLNPTVQVSDEKHDTTWYELSEFIRLLKKSNPTVLEALFVPDDCIHYMHPLFKELRDNRDKVLSKEIFNPFYGYAKQQVVKARGLNKKIVNPIERRKTILEFCYTFRKQGSYTIEEWSKEYDLPLQYFGLVNIPNMHNMFGAYYDWVLYFKEHTTRIDNMFIEQPSTEDNKLLSLLNTVYKLNLTNNSVGLYMFKKWLSEQKVQNYYGLLKNDSSTQLHLSPVAKGEVPLLYISYNEDGFISHCRRYKEYQEWVQKRNPVRYASNLNKNYDSKNIMHCFRLIYMCKEILLGQGFNVKRTEDQEFLMNIRNHKFEYDDLIAQLDTEVKEIEEAYKISTLPEKPDCEWLDNYLAKTIKEYIIN